jgi:hypothetical protein
MLVGWPVNLPLYIVVLVALVADSYRK